MMIGHATGVRNRSWRKRADGFCTEKSGPKEQNRQHALHYHHFRQVRLAESQKKAKTPVWLRNAVSMKQIQKCPHCAKDALFCGDLCPSCGHTSRLEERGEADLARDARGRLPVYTAGLDDELSPPQRRGRLLLGLVLGLLALPLAAWNAVNGCLLLTTDQGHELPWGRALLLLLGASVVLWKAWVGRRWAWLAGVAGAVVGGFWLLARLALRLGADRVRPLDWLTGAVLGVICLWCAWVLGRSRDIAEFRARQERGGGGGG